MRFPLVVLLVSVIGLGVALAADESEESGTPKRVLKKYRVRRPVIVDDQGNVVRAGPRLRRVRVKNPRPTLETAALVSTTPQIVSTSSSSSVSEATSQPLTQQVRVRSRVSQSQNSLEPQRIQQQPRQQQQQQQQQQGQTEVYFEEPSVVDQVRTVPTYRQATSVANRDALLANVNYKNRGTLTSGDVAESKKVGTTRNYSKINEDGSFTFGYEAEDGSFKEETRGVDCVVRGKYGYIDPEGVRREFEYVSGNPCDPNDPSGKGEEPLEDDEEEGPAPRPLLRQRVRPAEISENNIQGLQQLSEERLTEDQLANYVRPVQRQRLVRPNPTFQTGFAQPQQQQRQRVRITTPPPPTYSPSTESPALIIRQRPLSAGRPLYQEPSQSLDSDRSTSGRGFNFESEVNRITELHRPITQAQPLYEQPFRQVQHIGQSSRQVFGNPAFHTFQREVQEQEERAQPTQQSRLRPNPAPTTAPVSPSFGRYRTELSYDPSSGQYNSVISQGNANTNQEFELTQKLRAFVHPTQGAPTQPQFTTVQQFGQPQQQQQRQVQYYQPQQQQQQQQQYQPSPTQQPQDPSQINQFLARHAYRVHQDQTQQSQPQNSVNNIQFIPPHLRPSAHQTAEFQQQEVREINLPSPSSQPLIQSGNSANGAASTGQIDAFLRALNINIS